MLPAIDRKIAIHTWSITVLQVVVGLGCIAFNGLLMYPTAYTLIRNYIDEIKSESFEYKRDFTYASGFTALLNFISFFMVLFALLLIKRWIKEDFIGLRVWKCQQEGLFVLVLIVGFIMFVAQVGTLTVSYKDLSDQTQVTISGFDYKEFLNLKFGLYFF